MTKDMSNGQPSTTPAIPQNPYGNDIMALYSNNTNVPQSSYANNGMANDPIMNSSMPSLVSYTSSAGTGTALVDSFSNLALIGANNNNNNAMGVMQQQRNPMMYQQQPMMNNAMPMNRPMTQNPMINSNNMMVSNAMMMQNNNNNTMMMQNNNMMMQGGMNPMFVQGGMNNMMMPQGSTNMTSMNNGGNSMYQPNAYAMPGYGGGQTFYGNSGNGAGNPMGRHPGNANVSSSMPGQSGNTNQAKKSPTMVKDDPFAQFGMNVFRS
jgi:hypothetical protein